jgi:ectoine hydroxylase-related dioxygenase (phytanoyl-CoA dioxygenase family)
VQVRGLSARVTYPDQPAQETHWHFHQRLIPDPIPAFFSRPQTIDALIYLDDADDANGPLCVLPGSHQRVNEDLREEEYGELPGQVTLRLPAGSCVMCHGSLWHRALPNRPEGTVRRLLLLGYGPTWMKQSIYGEKPENGLTEGLLRDADEQTRELLGVAGYM